MLRISITDITHLTAHPSELRISRLRRQKPGQTSLSLLPLPLRKLTIPLLQLSDGKSELAAAVK